MKPYKLNLLNSITLIIFASWGFWATMQETGEIKYTPLIPVIFGIPLLLLNSGLKRENKTVAHIVVFLTLVAFIGLFMPLMGEIKREDGMGVFRVSVMLLSSLLALLGFIKSFIDARKNKS